MAEVTRSESSKSSARQQKSERATPAQAPSEATQRLARALALPPGLSPDAARALQGAIGVVAGLTAASGLWVLIDMPPRAASGTA